MGCLGIVMVVMEGFNSGKVLNWPYGVDSRVIPAEEQSGKDGVYRLCIARVA
jgi:hypothetical protein